MPALVFAAQATSTMAMFGLIWFVQVVHYPLFTKVGPTGFAHFAALHATRTTYVVGPLMLLELASSTALLFPLLRSTAVRPMEAAAGLLLLAVVWASTAFIQVPLHNRLQQEFDQQIVQQLVQTNWVRTWAWSLRAALVCVWLLRVG